MDFGLILSSYRPGATVEGIEAATELVSRLGWSTVWTTDHLLPGPEVADEYGHLFEALTTLAYLGGRNPTVRLGTSVIVVPMRNAIVVAKEFASLDALTRGRVIAGLGIGWYEPEFANVGYAERFGQRGAFLDETIALFRHLWRGAPGPFEGRFHRFDEVFFSPVPAQPGGIPIWLGGSSVPALARAGRLADGYQSSSSGPAQIAERVPFIREAAAAAGRPMPALSARVPVSFASGEGRAYSMTGTPEQMIADVEAFAREGVEHLAVDFVETDPDRLAALVERFDREVAGTVREGTPAASAA